MVKIIGKALPHLPWQEKPVGSTETIWRYQQNPIIGRHAIPTSHTISNSAAVPFKDGFAGVFRCDNRTGYSELHAGFSEDGIHWKIAPEKIRFVFANPQTEDSDTQYDPRVCEIDGRYYVTWCNDYHGPTIGVAVTDDFHTFTQLENALLPSNRNGVFFPRKINGNYMMLSRPSDWGHTPFGDIFLSQSPDLEYWGRHRHVMGRTAGWQSTKIGPGPVPIETTAGWLMLYHGVVTTCNGFVYSFGAALLDLDQPWKVIVRTKAYLFTPETDYETSGLVPNVVFPCAALADSATGRLAIYYGCADTRVGLCFGEVNEVIAYLEHHRL
jgi:beta-1,4-mannooligosaccharide/beta-1,4-mannosyl-N-acetylglucosamine phosphorylase